MQHVNLYRQLDRARELPFSARQQLGLFAVLAGLMFVIALLLQLGRWNLANEVETLTARQQAGQQQLEQLSARRDAALADDSIQNAVTALERERVFLREVLATIEQPADASAEGFAEHLTGLARQHVDGLWFTEISLFEGGTQMALLGQSREPEFLPRYLQKLNREPAFTGQRFRVFRMSRGEEQSQILNFEIRARGAE